jgi:hypothetical protein
VQEPGAAGVIADPEGDGRTGACGEGGELVVVDQERDVPVGPPGLPAHGDDHGPAADEDVVEHAGVPTGTDEHPRRDDRPAPI